jgi:hypothetical protein
MDDAAGGGSVRIPTMAPPRIASVSGLSGKRTLAVLAVGLGIVFLVIPTTWSLTHQTTDPNMHNPDALNAGTWLFVLAIVVTILDYAMRRRRAFVDLRARGVAGTATVHDIIQDEGVVIVAWTYEVDGATFRGRDSYTPKFLRLQSRPIRYVQSPPQLKGGDVLRICFDPERPRINGLLVSPEGYPIRDLARP